MVIVVFVLVTVPSDRLGAIIFTNGAYANLNLGATPTTVTATDDSDPPVTYTYAVVLSMEDTTRNVKWTSGTAEDFVTASAGNDIRFVIKGSRAQSQS